MKQLSLEMRNEIIDMTKNGHSQTEIRETTGVALATIRKYQREAGLLASNPNDIGGRISKTIPLPGPYEKACGSEDEEEVDPVMIADQMLKICGTETMSIYKIELSKDSVTVEGESIVGEIKIKDILKIASELKGVYNLANKMKNNRFDVM